MKPLLLAAAVAGLLSVGAVSFFAAAAEREQVARAPTDETLVIDHTALPGPTGWFLEKVTATEATEVTLETFEDVKLYGDGDGAAPLVGLPRGPLWFGGGAVSGDGLAVNSPHAAVSCCGQLARQLPLPPGGFGGEGGHRVPMQPGDELYIGLAAVGWHPESTFRATVTGKGLVQSSVGTGTNVATFDLAALARQDGTTVHAAMITLGQPGEGRVAFVAEHNAVVAFTHVFMGDANGRFRVALPDGQRLDTGQASGFGVVVGAGGPGRLELLLDPFDPGSPWPLGLAQGDPTVAWAPGIVADIPVPHRQLEWSHDEN